jgi:release factor glutamine methyltransferase
VLNEAVRLLATSDILQPRREALHILAIVRGRTPGAAWLEQEEPLAPVEAARFEEAVRQRVAGVPFAYATGTAGFRSLTLRADRRALIPRPETEGLVELALARSTQRGLAADIGTGTGCIALSLAREGRFDRVIAVENDPAAADLARENLALVAPPVAVDLRLGNLLEPLAGARFSLIVANPPYLTAAEYEALDPMVKDHEPRQALVSGVDGLDATRALLAGASGVLASGGLMALEIDERRAAAVRDIATAAGLFVSIHEDLFGRPRYALTALVEGVC